METLSPQFCLKVWEVVEKVEVVKPVWGELDHMQELSFGELERIENWGQSVRGYSEITQNTLNISGRGVLSKSDE